MPSLGSRHCCPRGECLRFVFSHLVFNNCLSHPPDMQTSRRTGRRSCSRSFRSTRWWPSQTTETTSGIKRSRRCCRPTTARLPLGGWLPYSDVAQNGRIVTLDSPGDRLPSAHPTLGSPVHGEGVAPVAKVCHLCCRQRFCSAVLVKFCFIAPPSFSYIHVLTPALSVCDGRSH